MQFGMNLLLWTDHLQDSLLPVLEELKRMGYDTVEVPVFDLTVEHYAAWGRRLDDLGLQRTAVTVRTAEDNPIDPDPKVRQLAVQRTRQALECCQALGAKLLVGPFHSALGHFTGQGPTEDEWRWAVECMQQVAQHAQSCGVTLGVEYLNRFECYLLNCAADTVRFVREVNHPACRMMYDTFHANIEEKDEAEAIRRCRDYLVHVHISENDRSTPGAGHVRWEVTFQTLRQIGYQGCLMVEAFGLALPSLAAATKIWRRMFSDELQLARDALQFMKSNWNPS